MKKKNHGVTLIELLIVIAIISVVATATGTSYFGVRSRKVFESEVSQIAADLRWTMNRSAAQEGGEQWGMRFSNPSGSGNDFYEVWMGDNYASGTVVSRAQLDSSVIFSDPSDGLTKDVIFSKSTGLPTASSTIEMTSLSGNSTGTIEINSQGRIDYSLN